TQLHHAYRELNGGATAPAALLKATLLNTANDMGNVGPDFKFGWGHLNAFRAFKLLEEGRYQDYQISQGESDTHTFNIPANVVEVRFMIYWNERSAVPGAAKALINDLDMVVTAPDGTTKLPWVLDPTPDPTTLNLPATNGEDHLNNVEQVVFDHPMAGEYSIDVSGFEVPFGPQNYFVLYEIITEEITVTYPIGGEGFEPSEQERLRWDAFGDDGEFLVEYTTDDGVSWETIATVAGTERMTLWTPPNQISGTVRVRVSRNGFSDESDENFSICNIPNNLSVEQFCPNYMRVSWNAVDGATAYDIFYLGEKYMDSVGTTTMTEFDIPLNLVSPFQDHWFSVRAKGANGLRGKRAIAVRYNGGLLNCILENDVATTQLFSPNVTSIVSCDAVQKNISIAVENTSINDQATLSFGYQINNEPPVTEMYGGVLAVGEVIEHTFSTPVDFTASGIYNLKTWSTIPNDDVFFNDTIFRKIIVSIGDVAVPNPDFKQDFEEDDFPPQDWFTSNTDGSFGWEQVAGVTGRDGNHTRAAIVKNRFYEAVGERDEIFSIPLDLTGIDNPILTFDLAYAQFTPLCSDTLLVEVYTECGDIFQEEIYRKSGSDLSTGGLSPSDWLPNQVSDWRTESIFLTDYIGEEVLLKMVNIAGHCNNLLIDNVNISNYSAPTAGFVPSAMEVCIGENILFTNTSTAILSNYNWYFGQGGSASLSTSANPDSIFYILPGEKEVRLIVSNDLGADTFFQVITVIDDPSADYSVNQSGGGYQFTNESEESDSYIWDFGDGTMSTDENPFKIYNATGNYTVKLTAVNACAEDFRIQSLEVMVTGVEDLAKHLQMQIFPNPNDGVFFIKIENAKVEEVEAELWDINGRRMDDFFIKNNNSNTFYASKSQHLPQGIYFVKIKTERGVVVERVVVGM
ncbi:MAG TPA: T9SS type A sorting domain-containing protein, partial [Phaeodactylibacter sp.]|nr:T9SS type A sorting domain-containing protein [Phaeodactylibacter sp.]